MEKNNLFVLGAVTLLTTGCLTQPQRSDSSLNSFIQVAAPALTQIVGNSGSSPSTGRLENTQITRNSIASPSTINPITSQAEQRKNDQQSGSNRDQIYKFDIAGVRLGMTEKEARAALVRYVPSIDGTQKDFANKQIRLQTKDFTTSNPVNGKDVRAGFVIEYTGMGIGGPGGFDFIKVFISNDKVWGVWRDDLGGRYSYSEARENLLKKYAGANPIKAPIQTVVRNSFSGTEGYDVGGVELMDGICEGEPYVRVNSDGEAIRLNNKCRTYFKVTYRIHSESGVRSLAGGYGQMVDYGRGQEYFAAMRGQARSTAVEDQKKLGKGNF